MSSRGSCSGSSFLVVLTGRLIQQDEQMDKLKLGRLVSMNILTWIQNWYLEQCELDEWHSWQDINGVKIQTLDNPGWLVTIDLDQTDLENKVFNEVNIERTEHDWIQCKVIYEDEAANENRRFIGAGGPKNLEEILEAFRKWAEM